MCGIIGYTGFRNAQSVLIDCLKKLEYRGYDSAGIGIIDNKLQIAKEIGEIYKLEKSMSKILGKTGIGHTRWATHGKVTKMNAHPHVSPNKKFAVVHNGIIENFKEIKEKLEEKGYKFYSETDSEVIAHLIESEYKNNLEKAVSSAVKKIRGSYAIVAICEQEPEKIVGIRKESPLVVGSGDSENFIASDIPALLKYTKQVIFLDDEELCILTKDKIKIYDKNSIEIKKDENTIKWDVNDSEKSGFSHFMLKEIYDQPQSLHNVLRGRVFETEGRVEFSKDVEDVLNKKFDDIHIVACGTSYYAAYVGKYILEELTKIPVRVEYSSEFRFFGVKSERSLIIAITQSGETADTIAALKEAKAAGCRTLVITNVMGSSATRIANGHILQQSGPEIGVAATKTFTSQIMVLFMIALQGSIINKTLGPDEIYGCIKRLKEIPENVRLILEMSDDILKIAKLIKNSKSIFFIGRGINYPLSLEGALKLKEISYIHSEGFAAGELKHGPFALLTKNTPVVAIITKDKTHDKMIANIGEIKARESPVIAIADKNDLDIQKHADYVIRFPSNKELLSSIPISVILQLLSFHVANLLGKSIDKPRNLAKSVTVE